MKHDAQVIKMSYYGPKLAIYFIIVLIAMLLIYHLVLNGHKTFLMRSFVVFQTFIFLWAAYDIANVLINLLNRQAFSERFYFTNIQYIINCLISFSWLMFSMNYSGSGKAADRSFMAMLSAPPLVFSLLFILGYFDLMYYFIIDIRKIFFYSYLVMYYAYLSVGTAILTRYMFRQRGYVKKQAALLSMGMILPLFVNIIQNLRLHFLNRSYELFGLDMTLIAFAATMLFIFIAASRYRFLNPLPYAMQELFNSMDQPALVLDGDNRVLSRNKAFKGTFPGFFSIMADDDAGSFAEYLGNAIDNAKDREKVCNAILNTENPSFNGEITLVWPEVKCYSISIKPIFINKVDFAGKVILFNDITELKAMIRKSDEANRELTEMYDYLKAYSEIAEELATERERNRIARDIHDSIGQTLTILSTMLNACIISCDKDAEGTREKLKKSALITREGLHELRRAVSGLSPHKLVLDNLLNLLKRLAQDYKDSGMDVDLSVEGMDESLPSEFTGIIYRVCQEALTNSVRHGKAMHAGIVIQVHEGNLRIYAVDDGIGCSKVQKGYGLTGMEQRVREVNGKIRYGSDAGSGFSIYVEIPISKKHEEMEAILV